MTLLIIIKIRYIETILFALSPQLLLLKSLSNQNLCKLFRRAVFRQVRWLHVYH